jgi:hypothetical protein
MPQSGNLLRLSAVSPLSAVKSIKRLLPQRAEAANSTRKSEIRDHLTMLCIRSAPLSASQKTHLDRDIRN